MSNCLFKIIFFSIVSVCFANSAIAMEYSLDFLDDWNKSDDFDVNDHDFDHIWPASLPDSDSKPTEFPLNSFAGLPEYDVCPVESYPHVPTNLPSTPSLTLKHDFAGSSQPYNGSITAQSFFPSYNAPIAQGSFPRTQAYNAPIAQGSFP